MVPQAQPSSYIQTPPAHESETASRLPWRLRFSGTTFPLAGLLARLMVREDCDQGVLSTLQLLLLGCHLERSKVTGCPAHSGLEEA